MHTPQMTLERLIDMLKAGWLDIMSLYVYGDGGYGVIANYTTENRDWTFSVPDVETLLILADMLEDVGSPVQMSNFEGFIEQCEWEARANVVPKRS